MTTKQPTKKKLSRRRCEEVWKKYVSDKSESPCFTGCGKIITAFNFDCGHIIAEARGGATTLANIVPICTSCNRSMGTEFMGDYCARNGFHPLIELIGELVAQPSVPATPASAPAAPAPIPTECDYDPSNMDIQYQLAQYKKLPILDRELGLYNRKARKNLLFECEFRGDEKYSRDLLGGFTQLHFHISHNATYIPCNWGEPGSGECLMRELLQELKRLATCLRRDDLKKKIAMLDTLLINYLKTMRSNMPQYDFERMGLFVHYTEHKKRK